MKRVLVVGPPCSGKTTTAKALAARLDAPHVELDALWWEPNWTPAPPERFRKRLIDVAAGPNWVLDGNYLAVGVADIVLPVADTVVWLDRSRWTTVPRGVRRTLQRVVLRTELWSGNREPLAYLPRMPALAWSAVRNHPRYNKHVEAHYDRRTSPDVSWVRLRTRASAREWLDSLPSP